MRYRRLLPLLMLVLVTTPASASTIDPAVVDFDVSSPTYTFTFELDNPTSSTVTEMDLEMVQNPSGEDYIIASSITGVEDGWNATIQQVDGENHTIHLTTSGNGLGPDASLALTADLTIRSIGQNALTLRAGGEQEQIRVTADSAAPQVTGRSPSAGEDAITRTISSVQATATDPAGIDTGASYMEFNGERFDTGDTALQFSGGTFSLDAGDRVEEGQNTMRLHLVDSFGHARNTTYSFTVAKEPVVFGDTAAPTGLISTASPTLQIEAADSAGITTDSTIQLDGDTLALADSDVTETDGATNRYRLTYPTNELDDGEYTPTFTIVDGNGNTATYSSRFRVDTTPPAFSKGPDITDGDQFTDSMEVSLEVTDQNGIAEVRATVGDRDLELEETSDGTYEATIDTSELDGAYDLTITAEDEAGNIRELTRSVVIDNAAPFILADSTTIEPAPTDRPPTLELRGEDSATQPVQAEYFIGADDPGQGRATELERRSQDGHEATFSGTIPIEDLSNGRYNVTVRIADSLDHWSSPKTISFLLNRSYSMDLEITSITPASIEQGTTATTRVQVQNTGQVPGPVTVRLQAEGLGTGSQERTIGVRQTRTFEVPVTATPDQEIGDYNGTLIVEGREQTVRRPVTLHVTPRPATADNITATIAELDTTYERLHNRTTRWRSSLGTEQVEEITEQLQQARQRIRASQEALDQGRYTDAYQTAPTISDQLRAADDRLTDAIEDHRTTQYRLRVLTGLIVTLLVSGAAAVVLYRREKHLPIDLDAVRELVAAVPTDIHRFELGLDTTLGDIAERFGQELGQEDEEDEGWTGYSGD